MGEDVGEVVRAAVTRSCSGKGMRMTTKVRSRLVAMRSSEMRTMTKERDDVDAAVEERSVVVAVTMVDEVELSSMEIFARRRCREGIVGARGGGGGNPRSISIFLFSSFNPKKVTIM